MIPWLGPSIATTRRTRAYAPSWRSHSRASVDAERVADDVDLPGTPV